MRRKKNLSHKCVFWLSVLHSLALFIFFFLYNRWLQDLLLPPKLRNSVPLTKILKSHFISVRLKRKEWIKCTNYRIERLKFRHQTLIDIFLESIDVWCMQGKIKEQGESLVIGMPFVQQIDEADWRNMGVHSTDVQSQKIYLSVY